MHFRQFIQFGHANDNLLKYCIISFGLLLNSFTGQAKNYYFSSVSGNDSYSSAQAQNQATPWKSISKLNSIFSTLVAGDAVYFKRGETFYGAITVNKSGSSGKPIIISAYGTGNRPIITGFTTLSSWASAGNGVYQATASGISNAVNMVTLNNQPQHIGRYPNLNAANGGYLNFESSSSKSITDNQLTSATNWTGSELVVRKAKHVIERWPISSHSGSVINYTPGSNPYPVTNNGFGYFIQKNIKCLDQLGEWFYNTSTKYLQMYFGTGTPTSYTIKVSTVDILLNTSRYSYISVSELAFEGANINAVNVGYPSANTSNVTVSNCDINFSGSDGIYATNSDYPRFENCNVKNSYNSGIVVENEGGISTFANIRYNTIKNTGCKPGMAAISGNSHQGITSYCTDAVIEYNNIDSTGYTGICFYYNNAKIRYNFISNFCFVKDDGGGINTWSGPVGGPVYKGREVKNNILINGIGAELGTPLGIKTAYGVYMDDGVVGVDMSGNSIANMSEAGLYIHNTHEVSITNNTVYNCNLNQILFVHDNITPTDPLRNVVFKKNIMVAKTSNQLCFNIRTVKNDINQTGPTDSNYYARPVDDGIVMGGLSSVVKTTYSVEGWKANFTSKDAHSNKSPKIILPYTINSLTTANKLTNGDFASNMSGISFWSSNSNQSTAWDNTSKITGSGSLRLSFPTSTTNVYTMCIKSVGAVSSSKNYILRFSTMGSTPNGIVRTYIRKTASPNNSLTPTQLRPVGTSKVNHEFLFTAPTTDAAASLVIEIQQNSGTTYIDNIELFEANTTTVSVDSQLRFEYNASGSAKTISLGANYIGIDGTAYPGSLTLQPYTSKVLIKNGGTVVTPTGFTASATSAAISCFGGSSTTTVSASGGSAPYTGTGAFSVNAGKGSLRLSVAAPVASAYTLLYAPIGSISSSKSYVLRFTTLGTKSGSLRASLRQTNTPWAYITSTQSRTFGTARVDHEFVFNAPATQTSASFLIEVLQSSGTVYIDNIAFFEGTSAGVLTGPNLYSSGQFESSISGITTYSAIKNHVASLDLTSKISSTYYFTVKDAQGSNRTARAMVSQPAAALQAISTAGTVTSSGGTTTVVVSASGGTSPYTGTGNYTNVKVGTYNYTVKDAKGCSSVTSITVKQGTAARAVDSNAPDSTAVSVVDDSASLRSLNISETNKLKISIYPNPSTTEFGLTAEGGSNEMVTISVLSIDGRVVFRTQGGSNKRYSIGNNLMTGMYIIQVTQGKTVQTFKVIKVK